VHMVSLMLREHCVGFGAFLGDSFICISCTGEPTQTVAIALFDYSANHEDEVELVKGDRVAILRPQDSDGWVLVDNISRSGGHKRTKGMAPLNLLMATRPLHDYESFVVAAGSYTAQTPHELSFAKGQSLILLSRPRRRQAFAARQGGGVGGSPGTGFDDEAGYGELPDGTKVGIMLAGKLHSANTHAVRYC